MNPFVTMLAKAFVLVAVGLAMGAVGIAIGAVGISTGETDDAPGAALIGILAMIGVVAFGASIALRATRLAPHKPLCTKGEKGISQH